MSLPGNDLLALIENENPKLGQYLRQYLVPAIQRTAQNAAVSLTGQIKAPAPPESVAIVKSGEYLHVQINHTAPIQKGARYITTIATNPAFTNAPIIKDHASRAPEPFVLPTKTSAGATQNYYVAAQVQYPGGPPSAPTYYGGAAPLAVTMGGSTEMDLLPGTGSGTATNGGQALVGLGKAQVRL
jgi:hypothetical protein